MEADKHGAPPAASRAGCGRSTTALGLGTDRAGAGFQPDMAPRDREHPAREELEAGR
jgi:hypothetical protein